MTKAPDYYIVWAGRNRDYGVIHRNSVSANFAADKLKNTGRAYISTGLDREADPIIEEIDWVPGDA